MVLHVIGIVNLLQEMYFMLLKNTFDNYMHCYTCTSIVAISDFLRCSTLCRDMYMYYLFLQWHQMYI